MLVFDTACRKYKDQTGKRVRLVVEDLHNAAAGGTLSSPAREFASGMVRLHNDGFLSAVFTMNDFEGVGIGDNSNSSIDKPSYDVSSYSR